MKASELRIGNWVTVMGSLPQQVTGYHIYMMETYRPKDSNEATYEDMTQPIPLTEEWLVKFGFGKSDECERGYNTHKHFGLYYDWHFKQFKLEVDDGANVVDILMQIHYVHQLQNLYYALTSEELTLKD